MADTAAPAATLTSTPAARRPPRACRRSSCPASRAQPGWEFTPLDKLDVDADRRRPRRRARPRRQRRRSATCRGAVRPSADEPTSEGPVVDAAGASPPSATPDVVEAPPRHASPRTRALVARNDAHWTDGTLVYVPRDVQVDAPIVLDARPRAGRQRAAPPHARRRSRRARRPRSGTRSLSADAEADGVVNGVVELVVGDGAHLRYVGAQDLNEQTWVFGAQRAVVEPRRSARLDHARLRRRRTARSSSRRSSPARRARRGHRRLRHAAAASTSTSTRCRSTRRRDTIERPRLPRHPRRPLERRLARDDPGRRGRPADRRLPGVAQPAADARRPTPTRSRASRSSPTTSAAPTPRRSRRSTRSSSSTSARTACRLPSAAPPGGRGLPAGDRRALRARARSATRSPPRSTGACRPSSADARRGATRRRRAAGPSGAGGKRVQRGAQVVRVLEVEPEAVDVVVGDAPFLVDDARRRAACPARARDTP